MQAYVQLREWWAETGAGITTEFIPEQRIVDIETRYGLTLPYDFRQYINFSSPVGEAMDERLGTWWNFERIRNIPDEYPYELNPEIARRAGKYLFFADHCFWCWAWAISCADDKTRGNVALIAGTSYDRIVAKSFTGFVRKYISDLASVNIAPSQAQRGR